MSNTLSANDTVVTINGGTITDASGNHWTLDNGQVQVNGVVDLTTANVIELAYVNGRIWQKNASNLWWAKSNPGGHWLPTYGTLVSPLFASTSPVSANDTVATAVGQTITDAHHNVWSISAGGQVVTDGIVDPTTANVIELAYVNGQVWQENANNLWWAKSIPGNTWQPTYGTLVNPLSTSQPVSANNTIVSEFSGQTITDAHHNTWSISAQGQVVVNGTVDPTTANVITLAYENGRIWQENISDLWWAKSNPGDNWLPANGTSASPIPTRLWVGGSDNAAANPANWSPAGVPQPGDTLQIGNGATINVTGNDLAGDTLNVINSGSAVTVNAKDSAQLDFSIPFSGVNLNVADTATLNVSAVHGVLNASGGTIQFIGTTQLGASRVILNDNLTGTATVALSGAQGEGTFVEVNGAAGSGLTFNLQSVVELQIDHPDQFASALTIGGGTPLETVLLAGLTATNGDLMNGVLSLFNGNQLVDQVRVGGNTAMLTLDQTSAGVLLDQNHIGLGGSTISAIPLTVT